MGMRRLDLWDMITRDMEDTILRNMAESAEYQRMAAANPEHQHASIWTKKAEQLDKVLPLYESAVCQRELER